MWYQIMLVILSTVSFCSDGETMNVTTEMLIHDGMQIQKAVVTAYLNAFWIYRAVLHRPLCLLLECVLWWW